MRYLVEVAAKCEPEVGNDLASILMLMARGIDTEAKMDSTYSSDGYILIDLYITARSNHPARYLRHMSEVAASYLADNVSTFTREVEHGF